MRLADAQFVGAATGAPADVEPFRVSFDSDVPGNYRLGTTARSFIPCTFATRPANPVEGDAIYEIDTGVEYVWIPSVGWSFIGHRLSAARSRITATIAEATVANGTVHTVQYSAAGDDLRASIASPTFTVQVGGVWDIRVTLVNVVPGGLGNSPPARMEVYVAGIVHSMAFPLGASGNALSSTVSLTLPMDAGTPIYLVFGNLYNVPVILRGSVTLNWLGV